MTHHLLGAAAVAALCLAPLSLAAQTDMRAETQADMQADTQADMQSGQQQAEEMEHAVAPPATTDIVVEAADGELVNGSAWFADLPESAPLIALFHQGGSNGHGEYGPLIAWLNDAGYRAIAWDVRKGGARYGGRNRSALTSDESQTYCGAYVDVKAAVENAAGHAGTAPLILWGSSFTGSHVFRAAVEVPQVDGVISFSPASGGPMADCHAGLYVNDVTVPVYVLRPDTEMEIASAQAQREMLEEAGVAFSVVEHGIHGSSMLVDERTEFDMAPARAAVMDWLTWVSKPAGMGGRI